MKSFKEFKTIAESRSREDAQKSLDSKTNPGDWELVNAGSSEAPSWRVRLKSGTRSEQGRSGAGLARTSKKAQAIKQREAVSRAQGNKKAIDQPQSKKPTAKKPTPPTSHPDKGKPAIGGGVDDRGRTGHDRANTPSPKPATNKPTTKPVSQTSTSSDTYQPGTRTSGSDFYRRYDKKR